MFVFYYKSFEKKMITFCFVVVVVVVDEDDDDDDDGDDAYDDDVFNRSFGCGVLLFCGISVITCCPKVTGLRQTHNRYD